MIRIELLKSIICLLQNKSENLCNRKMQNPVLYLIGAKKKDLPVITSLTTLIVS